jgi:hypothetical protein
MVSSTVYSELQTASKHVNKYTLVVPVLALPSRKTSKLVDGMRRPCVVSGADAHKMAE